MVFAGVEKLVYLGKSSLYVPEENKTKGGGRTHHTNTLVLVDPLVTIGNQKFIRTETGVDKTVDKGGGEISSGGVYRVGRAEAWIGGREWRREGVG